MEEEDDEETKQEKNGEKISIENANIHSNNFRS